MLAGRVEPTALEGGGDEGVIGCCGSGRGGGRGNGEVDEVGELGRGWEFVEGGGREGGVEAEHYCGWLVGPWVGVCEDSGVCRRPSERQCQRLLATKRIPPHCTVYLQARSVCPVRS